MIWRRMRSRGISAGRDPTSLSVGSGTVSVLRVTSFPPALPAGWLSDILLRYPFVSASLSLYRMSRTHSAGLIDRTVLAMGAEAVTRMQSGKHADALVNDADELRALAEDVRMSRTSLHYASLLLAVCSTSQEGAESERRLVESELASSSVSYTNMRYRQLDGLREFALDRRPSFAGCPVVSADSLPALIPFTGTDVADSMGTFLGVNAVDGSAVVFDRFSLPNFNAAIVGKSGSGKSFFAKLIVMRESAFPGMSWFVIDPLGEFFTCGLGCGGEVVDVAREGLGLNLLGADEFVRLLPRLLLYLRHCGGPDVADSTSLVALASGIAAYNPSLTPSQIAAECISSRGSSDRAASVYGSAEFLRLMGGNRIPSGGRALTVFDLGSLPRDRLAPMICLISALVYERCRRLGGRKTLIVDEAWNLSRDGEAANVMSEIMRHSRHYGLGVILLSQNVDDFRGGSLGEGILNNCSSYFIFRHERGEGSMGGSLSLSDGEYSFISDSVPRATSSGRCIFITSRYRIPLLVPSSVEERLMCSSDAPEHETPEGAICRMALDSLRELSALTGGGE